MKLNFVKVFILVFLLSCITLIGFGIANVVDQMLYSVRLIETYGPICTKSAIREFQTEDMTWYEDNGVMSSNYINYLGWLESNSEMIEVANLLRTNFEDGENPTNYALPYIDKDKLEVEINSLLEEQFKVRVQTDDLTRITKLHATVLSVDKEFKNFNTDYAIWGNGSSFYSNTLGYDMTYNYANYISYTIKVKIDADINFVYPTIGFNIPVKNLEEEFTSYYELVN